MNAFPPQFAGDVQGGEESKDTDFISRNGAEQFESGLMNVPVPIYVVDADFKLRLVNPMARPVLEASQNSSAGILAKSFASYGRRNPRMMWSGSFATHWKRASLTNQPKAMNGGSTVVRPKRTNGASTALRFQMAAWE